MTVTNVKEFFTEHGPAILDHGTSLLNGAAAGTAVGITAAVAVGGLSSAAALIAAPAVGTFGALAVIGHDIYSLVKANDGAESAFFAKALLVDFLALACFATALALAATGFGIVPALALVIGGFGFAALRTGMHFTNMPPEFLDLPKVFAKNTSGDTHSSTSRSDREETFTV